MSCCRTLSAAALCAATTLAACSSKQIGSAGSNNVRPGVEPSEGLILQAAEGERRVRRPRAGSATAQTTPFILKVDALNGASPDLVMGYEEIAQGEAIQPHRHLIADEIVFVHSGNGIARLGNRESPVRTGATLYIPRNTPIGLRNTGSEPLGVAFIFSKPGFEQLMRENSAREGEPATSLSAEEQAQIRARHRWHTIAGAPDPDAGEIGNGGLILQAGEGERRVRRPRTASASAHLTTTFILKVDRRNGESPDLVMGYEDIAPGDAIPAHRHLLADEIIFVHTGSGLANLGARESAVEPGTTIYIPRGSRITLRNTGTEPLGILFVFSSPGFEDLMRETSVPEGEVASPLSVEEQAIRARHRWHTIYK